MEQNIRTHTGALETIVRHPEIIGLDKKDIFAIIREVELFKYQYTDNDKACDLVILYDVPYNHSDLIELKCDNSYPSNKALGQLENTEHRFCDRIGYPVTKEMIVYYPSMRLEVLE